MKTIFQDRENRVLETLPPPPLPENTTEKSPQHPRKCYDGVDDGDGNDILFWYLVL